MASDGRSRSNRELLLACEVIDAFIGGADVTPTERAAQTAFVLRDLALAVAELARQPRGRRMVQYASEPWELCVERFGKSACLSVYRTGPDPLVTVYDRVALFDEVVSATAVAVARALSIDPPGLADEARLSSPIGLAAAAQQLSGASVARGDDEPIPALTPVSVEVDPDSPISFGADFAIRAAAQDSVASPEAAERTDLHALLFRGRMRAEIRGRSVDLGECHPTLVAERLVDLSRRAFDAWERGLALNARGETSGLVVGVRVSPGGELALTLGSAGGDPERALHTFPALGVTDMLEAALSFGRSLVRAILRRDRSQATNLRLVALRLALRESTEALRHACRADSKVNPSPEPYRAFAAAIEEARAQRPASPAATRLRYAPRWRAIVPGLDLRATYLCGDRLVAGAATEMWALDRGTGRVLWRADATRGTSVVTPGGIARLAPDGRLSVHDFGTGETTLRTRIAARVGGPVAGAVVSAPGLPKLVVVTEGEHHLVAVDLTSGETRWRWSWGRVKGRARGAPRMKRAGKLV
ncbi:MAG: PQQ-binding-like beta-propeller repeat protein, partial [Polyangiaceae bacterium]